MPFNRFKFEQCWATLCLHRGLSGIAVSDWRIAIFRDSPPRCIKGFEKSGLDGDWAAYIEQWADQQKKLKNWIESSSRVVIRNGIASLDVRAVIDYMRQVEKRLEITRCLAIDEGFEGLDDFNLRFGRTTTNRRPNNTIHFGI